MSYASIFARILSRHGHRKRRQSERERYKATHDELRRRLGMAPIEWKR